MSDQKVFFYDKLPLSIAPPTAPAAADTAEEIRLEPSTCTEAETFALHVLDDSMQPEFRRGCIIVIDPTGRATDGSYVLARRYNTDAASISDDHRQADKTLEAFTFRQLRRTQDNGWQLLALNEAYESENTASDLSDIIGVIVQRAGTRRRYHKHYA